MVAVVDDETERWVQIGPTTAAGERRSLMHNDLEPDVDKTHSRAQARNAREDDIDRANTQRRPYPRSAPSRRNRLALARRRGGAKPSFPILSRIEPYATAINRGAFTAARGDAAIMDCAWSKCSRARAATATQAYVSFGSAAAASGSSVVPPAAASASRGR